MRTTFDVQTTMVHISHYLQTANAYHLTLHVTRQDLTIAWFALLLSIVLRPKFMWSVLVEACSIGAQITFVYVVADFVVMTLWSIERLA